MPKLTRAHRRVLEALAEGGFIWCAPWIEWSKAPADAELVRAITTMLGGPS